MFAYRVIDRFDIKMLTNVKNLVIMKKDCQSEICCGYCCQSHLSTECEIKEPGIHSIYECVNSENSNKEYTGHSSHWHKCPSLRNLVHSIAKKTCCEYLCIGMSGQY